MAHEQQHVFRYRNFTILKDQTLGHGSYGAVYKAKCDQLTCAAKVLHPTIVDPYDPGSGKILQRFEQECDFLNAIRHPHIVQYLGVCRDPESNLPVLLMELLDESLTKLLEHSPFPIPYHIQVDLCCDISLAVAYLHSNGIIHRDLSGNNVLVIAGRRAKVTDFGMSKLTSSERHFTPLTLCPGTLGYMSPESLKEPPRYTEKLDVFSQGVIMIQVCTQEFPNPGPAVKEITDSRSPTGIVQVPVLEPERRKKHIDLIDPSHPLLPIAIACLEYSDTDRSSAEELCQRLGAQKESQEYVESSQNTTGSPDNLETVPENRSELVKQIEEKTRQVAAKDQQIGSLRKEINTKDQQIAAFQLELAAKSEQVEIKDRENFDLRRRLQQLTAMKLDDNQKSFNDSKVASEDDQLNVLPKPQITRMCKEAESDLKFRWKDGGTAPFKGIRRCSVVDGSMVYFLTDYKLYSYNSSTRVWNTKLPTCVQVLGSLALVQGLLTMVGGYHPSAKNFKATNKLVSLTKAEEGGQWIEHFPSMPTSRHNTTANTYQNHLIVVGGSTTLSQKDRLDIVEVLNTDTLLWFTAASLPHPYVFGSATVCGDQLYLLGGEDKDGSCRSVLSCLLPELLVSCRRDTLVGRLRKLGHVQPGAGGVWQRVTDAPIYDSTCATVCGQLLAVGGRDNLSLYESTTAIYKYDQTNYLWNVISHMRIARRACYVAVIDTKNELLVVSGLQMDSVEIAHF